MSREFSRTVVCCFYFKESVKFRQSLLPWLVEGCAEADDTATLHRIRELQSGFKFNISLPCGSMPLHICAKHGAIKCADLLLRSANDEFPIVNEPDLVGFTPLFYAVLQQHEAMIDLLVRYGAKLTVALKPSEIGMYLCNCVKNNLLNQLKSWHKAGANLDQTDYDGRTPLLMVINLFSSIVIIFSRNHFHFIGCEL